MLTHEALNKSILFYILILISIHCYPQNLENIKDQQPLTINGYISTNQVFNAQLADTGYVTNYTGYYAGSMNFNIYGVSVPLTFIYSNQQGNFAHPFNQYGMHPSYKWIRGHVGYATMSFSPYTLNGHLFCGAGVEADPPGIFRGSAMYGQLRKAIPYDTSNVTQFILKLIQQIHGQEHEISIH